MAVFGSLTNEGDSMEVQGSGAKPYVLKNTLGVLSCSCPSWRNAGGPISNRTCKHLIAVLGADAENARVNPGGGLGTSNPGGFFPGKNITAIKNTDADWAMLAETYAPTDKLVGWYWSEKLDGVRLLWDPMRRVFVTRNGNIVKPPDWFVADFPALLLDGELWMGRGKFQEASSLARSSDGGDRWNSAFYMIFDIAVPNRKWEERLAVLVETANTAQLKPHGGVRRVAKKAFLLPQMEITYAMEIEVLMNEVIQKGGEGLMFRKPGSLYVPRRSPALLKHERFHTDEAKVLAVLEGTGKFKGVMGALKVVNRQGAEFAVGSGFTDEMRRVWWGLSSAQCKFLEYRFQEQDQAGMPRFPTFVRFRPDLTSL